MKPIFVGGCERSGTTLLASLLAGHDDVIAPPEAQFYLDGLAAVKDIDAHTTAEFARHVSSHWRFSLWGLAPRLPQELAQSSPRPSDLMANLVATYAREVCKKKDARNWVDHTPLNVGYASTLLSAFGDAPMVHIIRDPRAVVASLLPLDWGPPSPRIGARWWLSRVAMGLAAEGAFPDRVIRVYYEDLVRDPYGCLARLCPRLGLTFQTNMVDAPGAIVPAYTLNQHALVGEPPDPTRIDAWHSHLSSRDVAVIEGELGDVPSMLGYSSTATAPAITPASSAYEFSTSLLRSVRQRWRYRARVRRAIKHPTGSERRHP
jgi:hypothetical protein